MSYALRDPTSEPILSNVFCGKNLYYIKQCEGVIGLPDTEHFQQNSHTLQYSDTLLQYYSVSEVTEQKAILTLDFSQLSIYANVGVIFRS